MTAIYEQRLPNRLRVVGYHLPGMTAALGLIVTAGSCREPDGQQGVGHVLNQAVFRRTRLRDAVALREALEESGLRRDSALNPEWARYWLLGLADDVSQALPLLAECVLAPGLDRDDDVAAARAQALGRLRKRREQRELYVTDLLRSTAYSAHPLANPTLGGPDAIAAVTADQVRAYHAEHYHAAGMVLAIAGEFDWDRVLDVAAASFPASAARPAPPPPAVAPTAVRVGEIWPIPQQQVALSLPGPAYDDPRFYAWAVVTQILGGGFNSRLFTTVRERLGLTYGVSARLIAYSCAGQVLIYGATTPDRATPFVTALVGTLRDLTRDGVTVAELATAKAQLASNLVMRGESTAARMHTVLTSALMEREVRGIEQTDAAIQRVTLDDVAEVVARWDPSTPLGLATVGPVPIEEVSVAVEPVPAAA